MSRPTTRSAPRLCALLMAFAVILAAVHLAAVPTHAAEWRQDADDFSRGSFMRTEVDSAGSLSLSSFVGANLALGTLAVAGENTLTGSRSLTDGDPSTEWRLKIMREDPPNWVSIGDIQVFGEGFRARGTFDSEVFDAGGPINVGQIRFTATAPDDSEMSVQLRTSTDNVAWAAWHRVPEWGPEDGAVGVAGQEPEPARYLQYRVTMETFHPLRSPRLEELTVTYDEQLFATHLSGQITPLRPVLGAETVFTYTLNSDPPGGCVEMPHPRKLLMLLDLWSNCPLGPHGDAAMRRGCGFNG